MPETPLMKELLAANEDYSRTFDRSKLPLPPAKKLAVLTCMDARIDAHEVLGLREGDAHVFRNAGGTATDDAIRSLIISSELLGTREFLVINHTDCGMLTFKDADLQKRLQQKYKVDASGIAFHAFPDLKSHVKEQVFRIRETPLFPKDLPVTGFVYHVESGRLERVT
jgi:carbonic anhydrase